MAGTAEYSKGALRPSGLIVPEQPRCNRPDVRLIIASLVFCREPPPGLTPREGP